MKKNQKTIQLFKDLNIIQIIITRYDLIDYNNQLINIIIGIHFEILLVQYNNYININLENDYKE